MTTENTTAAEPSVPSETTSPVATETTQVPAPEATDQTSETTAEQPADKPDYGFVPPKFLNADGTPDFEKLSKSYIGLEKKLGSKPNIPAGSVDDYEYDFSAYEPPEENVAKFKELALQNGFTKEQYKFVIDSHFNVINELVWSAEKTEGVLKEEWGKDFAANTNAARAGFEEFAPSDANPNDPVWNHPAVMKLLARMGQELGEDTIARKVSATSNDSIQEQIKALRNDPNYYTEANQKKMADLYGKLK